MKYIKIILTTFIAAIALQTAQLNAVLISSRMLGGNNKLVSVFGERHNAVSEQQFTDIKKMIDTFDPNDVCVITEAIDFPLTKELAERVDADKSMVQQFAQWAESNKIEIHKIDFRKIVNQANKVVSIRNHAGEVTVQEFLNAVRKQFEIIDKLDPKLIPVSIRTILAKVQEVCAKPEFTNKKASDLFTHFEGIEQDKNLLHRNMEGFIYSLLELKAIALINSTKKRLIFVVVGHEHAAFICKYLEENGSYTPLFAQQLKTASAIADDFVAINISDFKENLLKVLTQQKGSAPESSSSSPEDSDEKKSTASAEPISKKQKTTKEE